MQVRILSFEATPVALLAHRGPPEREHETALRLVQWRIRNRLSGARHASWGVHHTDPRTTPPHLHRVDFCVSFDGEVPPNPEGVVAGVIPACRCAVARHQGSWDMGATVIALHERWLPGSGERPGGFPLFFHYVNVGPGVAAADLVTDVYLPLASGGDR